MPINLYLCLLQQFQGNYDRYSIRTHAFKPALFARYVRINPRGWRSWISMRLELYGCPWSKCLVLFLLNNTFASQFCTGYCEEIADGVNMETCNQCRLYIS